MSQTMVFILLALALVLPVLGAIVLRLLLERLPPAQIYAAAALIFSVAIASVLLLARANVTNIQIGELSLLLPAAVQPDQELPADRTTEPVLAPPTEDQQLTPDIPPTIVPSTETPTAAPSVAPTSAPTAIPATPTTPPSATPAPPTAAPTAPAAPARRTYVVRAGDTLRSIAEQFGVSVQALVSANNLTPAQADSLRVGEELVIP